jgi:selenocysteine lyase/cysteine desulfurase
VQDGMATKAFVVKSMIRFLKDVYGFKRVILFAHDHSSNYLPLIQLAN